MPLRTRNIKKTCLQCNKEFFVSYAYLQSGGGNGRFCSQSCRTIYYNKLGVMGNKRDFVFISCEVCGKVFKVSRRRVEKDNTRFCSMECRGEAQSSYQMREANPSWKGSGIEVQCENCGKVFLSFSREPGRRQRFCSRLCYLAHAEEINAFGKEILANLRKDQNFVHKMVLAQQRKPTNPEKKLAEILNNYFPNEWKYTGDGSFSIKGYWPDFTNCNGRKEIIEVFGDYWHSPEVIGDDWRKSELGKIMSYNSFGYSCLIIWQHELEELPEEAVVAKIHQFQKAGKNEQVNIRKHRE